MSRSVADVVGVLVLVGFVVDGVPVWLVVLAALCGVAGRRCGGVS